MLKNSHSGYGLVSIFIHWITAITVIGLFASGLYMMSLGYYDPLYRIIPYWHKSIGLILAGLTFFRLCWMLFGTKPKPLASHAPWEILLAKLAHILLYLGLIMMFISGYLISTADGRTIEVFTWFEVPAWTTNIENQEDIAGLVHEWVAYGFIGLAASHGLAALKHHFHDKDYTLRRMIKPDYE